MKKTLFISISLMVVLFITFYYFIFQITIHHHRAMFKEFLLKDHQAVQKLEIDPSQLYSNSKHIIWNNDSEIRFNNIIYDIVSIKKLQDKVILYIVADEVEEALLEKLERQYSILHGQSGENDSSENILEELLSLEFTSDLFEFFSKLVSSEIHFQALQLKTAFGYPCKILQPPAFIM